MSLDIMNMLMKINHLLKKTVIVVTHDLDLVEYFGHRFIRLGEGKINSDVNLPSAAEAEGGIPNE
jgi:energy-coupling factor transporter ATP-binding protein EcfA2